MADGACNKCGSPIDFRFVDGVCTPIHRGGTCTNTVDWSNRQSRPSLKQTLRRWKHRDCCVPSKFPKCQADVFFVRHNGGSVWFDELGWPWPKHTCFADQVAHHSADWILERMETAKKVGLFGVIVSKLVVAEENYKAKFFALSLSNQTGVCVRVDPSAPMNCGDLVAIEDIDCDQATLVANSGSKHVSKVASPSELRLGSRFLKTGRT